MSIASKLLPAIVVAAALSPLAAYAHSNPQPGPTQYLLHHQDAQKYAHADEVIPGCPTIDSPSPIYGGVGPNSFPDSFGG
jgi:hypothetical protein